MESKNQTTIIKAKLGSTVTLPCSLELSGVKPTWYKDSIEIANKVHTLYINHKFMRSYIFMHIIMYILCNMLCTRINLCYSNMHILPVSSLKIFQVTFKFFLHITKELIYIDILHTNKCTVVT